MGESKFIQFKLKENTEEEIINVLNPIVKDWFFSRFQTFSPPQKFAVMEIHKRNNVLVSAPTGSGKTITAFLSILNELVNLSETNSLTDQVYCVYISPLKALNNDIFVNLKQPLEEIKKIAKDKYGKDFDIRVAVRTGDTTSYEKSKMTKKPPHILVTTPESLAIVLSSLKFREHLKQLWWCVVDEVHALAENKRGTHLSTSLERLNLLSNFTRIGLSATVAPLEEIAKYVVGEERPCQIIDIQAMKKTDIKVISPVSNLIKATYEERETNTYELLDKLIQEHKTTLIFTNTRAGTERVVHNLREKFPQKYTENIGTEKSLQLIGAHHGSLSKKHRFEIEQQLRDGKLKCVVCSTSLELGIDIGFIDLVILLGSPKSVARALQRIGRSGHKLQEISKGRIVVLDRDDLVECSLILKAAVERKIDRIHIPKGALDVLAQQVFGMSIVEPMLEEDIFNCVRKSYCYKELKRFDFDNIISYLAGEYVQLMDRHVYAKVWRNNGKIGRKSPIARMLYMTNIGTIPDETNVVVKVGNDVIGTIDEGFLESMKSGDIFVLGGATYEFKFSRGTVAQVQAVSGRLPTVPSWVSEMLPLSFDLADSIQKFRQYMNEMFVSKKAKSEILNYIISYLYIDENTANSIYEYFKEQFQYAFIPNRKLILVENFDDEGKTIHMFHSLYGRRVNDVLSRAIAFAISKQQKRDVRVSISDNGFTIQSDAKIQPLKAFKLLHSFELHKVMDLAIERSQVLVRRFRHCATRSLMILRNYKGNTKNVGKQQVSSMILMVAVKRISNDFPILKEARREVLEDKMDIDNAIKVLKEIEEGLIEIKEINTKIPSPFAFNLALMGYTDILKIEDKIDFVKRMHEMVIARIGLEKSLSVSDIYDLGLRKEMLVKKVGENVDENVERNIKRDVKGSVDGNSLNEIENKLNQIGKEFSYEKEWDASELSEKDRKEKMEEDYKDKLIFQLKRASHRINLDASIEYEIVRLINGERDGFKKEFKEWLNNFLKGAVPKFWGDDIVKFLMKCREKI